MDTDSERTGDEESAGGGMGQEMPKPDTNDGGLAIVIIIGVVVLLLVVAYYLWKFRSHFGFEDKSWKTKSFQVPVERAQYIEAKKTYNPADADSREEIKKLLMRRAMMAIPMVLSLQNEGNAIERLYKKGMLTDDMHFRVKELKAFVEQEFQEVQAEAEEFLEGWSAHIWPQAMQFHTMVKKHVVQEGDEEDEEEKGREVEESTGGGGSVETSKVTAEKKKAAVKSAKEIAMQQQLKDKTPEQVAEIMAAQLLKEEEQASNKGKPKGGKALAAKTAGKERKITPVNLD